MGSHQMPIDWVAVMVAASAAAAIADGIGVAVVVLMTMSTMMIWRLCCSYPTPIRSALQPVAISDWTRACPKD